MHPSSKPQKNTQRNITPNFLKFKRTTSNIQANLKQENPMIKVYKCNQVKEVVPRPVAAVLTYAKKEY